MDTSKLAHPKPEPRKRTKARKERNDAVKLRAFRDAVWERETTEDGLAFCQQCGCYVSDVTPKGWPVSGEVHHIISRRYKATRYDPANGRLLCRACHRAVTEHRTTPAGADGPITVEVA